MHTAHGSSALVLLRGTNVGNFLPTFRPGGARAISRVELDPAEVPAPARLHVDELSRATPTSSTQTGLPRKNSPRPLFQTILVVAASGRCFERGHEERIALLGKLVRIALLGKL